MCALRKYRSRLRDQVGATMVEYALIIAAIALVVVGAAFSLSGAVEDLFDDAEACVSTPSGC